MSLISNNEEIVFYDECLCMLRNNNFKAWRTEEMNNIYFGERAKIKTMLVLACSKNRIVYYKFKDKYVDSEVHIQIFSEIKEKLDKLNANKGIFNRTKFTVFLDNASCHTSYISRDFCITNQIKCITSPPYHSHYNLAELVFRHLKNMIYKKNFFEM